MHPHPNRKGTKMTNLRITTGEHYLAFVLDEATRNEIISLYATSAHKRVLAHHVTVAFKITEADIDELQQFIDQTETMVLNGLAMSSSDYPREDGVAAFRVLRNGSSKRPIDGATLHLTLSVGDGYKPVDSNRLFDGVSFPKVGMLSAGLVLHGKWELVPYRR